MGLNVKKNSFIAIIPAKAISQRLPNKNSIDFCGKPLLYYSIRAAQLAKEVSYTFVSSESEDILNIAKQFDCQVIKRPSELSQPHITNIDVLFHGVNTINENIGYIPEFIVLLQPTHPLRIIDDINNAIDIMKSNKQVDTLITCIKDDRVKGTITDNTFHYIGKENKYINTGSFYILRTRKTILQKKIFAENTFSYMLNHPEYEIDIDYPHDLALARCMMQTNTEVFSDFWEN
jgi:CMP-N-acetylneuraminic acid synthetase